MNQINTPEPYEIVRQKLKNQLQSDQSRLLIFAGTVLIMLLNLLFGGKELFGAWLWKASLMILPFCLLVMIIAGLLNAYLQSQIEDQAD